MISLPPKTTVYYRAEAYNIDGWGYGAELTFDTLGYPDVSTVAATYVKKLSANLNGSITDVHGINADYRGFVWDTSTKGAPGDVNPWASGYANSANTSGSFEAGAFNDTITTVANTDYYFRAFAHNTYGWVYGDELTFTSLGLALWFQPNAIIAGTLLPDRAGDNDGTFTWGANSGNVSANMTGFAPQSEAHADALPGGTWPTMIDDAPEQPATTYTEDTRPGFFFEPIVHTFLDLGGIPDMFFWYNFCFFIIIAAGMIAYRIHPSLIMKCIVMGALMIFFALPGLNVYGMFTFIYFALYSFGIIIISRSQGI